MCPGVPRLTVFAVMSGLLLQPIVIQAQTKTIRLRTGPLLTEPQDQSPALRPAAVETPLRGLHLIQFTAPPVEAWRETLRDMGVELVRYVPDDAFVARIEGVAPARIRALPYVHWVGPYRPEYRVDPRLRPDGSTEVLVLLAPGTSAPDETLTRRLFETVHGSSATRLGKVVRGRLAARRLAGLARSDAVLWIEPAPRMRLLDEISSKITGGDDGLSGTSTITQSLGFDGSGITVAVADSGLDGGEAATMHPDLAGRVTAFFHYGLLDDASDEHSHGTHVAGIIAGNAAVGETDELGYRYGLGVAPGSRLVAQRIFDGLGGYQPPPSFEALTRDAVQAGAVIGSNSWGDEAQGRYDLTAAEFDALVRDADATTPGDQPYILEFSAGNSGPGPQTIMTPALAKNVVATGAAQNDRPDLFIYSEGQHAMADFSSRGPCEDGRIKPDVVAPGTWIASLKSSFSGDENAWLPISFYYLYQGGTSQSGPHVSGAAAVFAQYYRETVTNSLPSPALVKAALINSAVDLDDSFGTRPAPNMDEGWGRVDLTRIIGSPRRYDYLDQTAVLRTGESYVHRVIVADPDEPLKITLAWTDEPGFPGAIPALVNDLDLEVLGPDGRVYRGNQFISGESAPGASGFDRVNNVEGVHLSEPAPGEYLVTIRAHRVVADARRDLAGVNQDFALVVSGSLPLPGVGVVFFDRAAYRAPANPLVKLIDFDLAGTASVDLRVFSSTEPEGEPLTLLASGPAGVFTNSIMAVSGEPAPDGMLQIADGDTIEARYEDASPPAVRRAFAEADFTPPTLTQIGVTNRFGRMVVFWSSDEPATSVVRYGPSPTPTLATTNTLLVFDHVVELDDLVPGETYVFLVESIDEAGNLAVADNDGELFTFVAVPASPVLLVNAYVHLADYESTPIPVTEYTDALDAIGIPYEIWSMDETGFPSPTADDLRPFNVVIWRINDSFWDQTSLTGQQQGAIQQYLAGGGAFFMASMEILSRLGDVPFRREVLQVDEWRPNPEPFGETCEDCDEDRGLPLALGVDHDPVTSGMAIDLDYSLFPFFDLGFFQIGPDLSDTFRPTTNATAILSHPFTGRAAGARLPRTGQDSPGRVVFLSFPLETVPTTGPAPNNRAHLLRNVMSFLAPAASGFSTIAMDRPSYTIPSQVTIEVADADLAGQGAAPVTVFSDSDSSGLTITLQETAQRGLFRGTVALAHADAGPAPAGRLPTRGGEIIRAEYHDASANVSIQVAAEVDVVPAEIMDVEVEPDYESAEVSWLTSEPTDALVQYWESGAGFPNNRTAYRFEPDDLHFLTLHGLQPDRIYYFQVIVRDPAGNVTIDNNEGQYYTFRTLKPIVPPWLDDMEAGSAGWVVFDADGTESSWQLGVPGPGTGTTAHSPSHAWGSNLSGNPIGFSESFLISPAIELTGGNVATLRFWHFYDFAERSMFDILEFGELLLVTNALSAPITLAQYDFLSDDWEEITIDLTPHLGRVVYVVWHYVMFSLDFETFPNRPGWIIDDVAVSMQSLPRGSIVITNNLAQARFTLSGPVNRSGQGWETTLTNLPLGDYTVTYTPVPAYRTPNPITKTVVANATTTFSGIYDFEDVNGNQISDAWEVDWFSEVSHDRTNLTDSDNDGASDYIEFISGTDPTNPESLFTLPPPRLQSNGSLILAWSSFPGRAYRVEASSDFLDWDPVSNWIRADNTQTSVTLPAKIVQACVAFRIEVRP
jgi:hypothetical protein